MRVTRSHIGRCLTGIVLLILCCSVVSAAPQPPASYWGNVTINGESAPAGITVAGYVDGEQRGIATTNDTGAYGGPRAFASKLDLTGTSADNGKTVRFTVGGLNASQTAIWTSGAQQRVDLTVTDTQAPTAVADLSRSGHVGEAVQLRGRNSSDNGAIVSYRWRLPNGSTLTGSSVSVVFNNPGNYTVQLTVRDIAGQTDTDSVNVRVRDRPSSSSSQQTTGGGSGQTDETLETEVVATDTGQTLIVRNAPAGEQIVADFGETTQSEIGSVTRLTLQPTFSESVFRVQVTAPSRTPGSVSPLSTATPLAYFRADAIGLSNDRISAAMIRIALSPSALPRDAAPEQIRLYRYHDGTWHALSTDHLGNGTYVARTPGFSSFAIGVVQRQTGTATRTATMTPSSVPTTASSTTTSATPTATDLSRRTAQSIPGFGLVGALVALLLTVILRVEM